jgi:hypothetical protein
MRTVVCAVYAEDEAWHRYALGKGKLENLSIFLPAKIAFFGKYKAGSSSTQLRQGIGDRRLQNCTFLSLANLANFLLPRRGRCNLKCLAGESPPGNLNKPLM